MVVKWTPVPLNWEREFSPLNRTSRIQLNLKSKTNLCALVSEHALGLRLFLASLGLVSEPVYEPIRKVT